MCDISCNVVINGAFLELSSDVWTFTPVKFHATWLRDHCRCEKCYNAVTYQRRLTLLDMPEKLKIEKCCVQNGKLHIECNHFSWLFQNNYEYCAHVKCIGDKQLWDGDVSLDTFAQVNREEFMTQEDVAKQVVLSLHRYGVAMVHEVQPTEADTEAIVRRLFPVQRTLFGDMWTFSDVMAHSDTAYTTEALGAHNDNTYFMNAAGLQVFHCLEHNGEGGETLLIDGFNVAKKLQKDNPQCFERLTKRCLLSEYIESGQHYTANGPVIKLKQGSTELEQMRFNIYDRGPVKIPQSDMADYYEDMKEFSLYIKNAKQELWFKLRPGTVLFFDNWRCFHGRAAYSGHRVMSGCYVSRDDWLSKATTMNIVN